MNKNSVSSIIKNAMESKGLDKDKLARQTLISDHFLDMLLKGKFKNLPPRPYAHGYILKIAQVLELDKDDLWQKYLEQSGTIKSSGEKDRLPENRFLVAGFNVKLFIGIVIGVIVIIYFGWQIFFSFNMSNILSLENFDDSMIVTESDEFIISGQVNRNYKLIINEEDIITDSDGYFEKEVTLSPGFNNFTFSVQNALGKGGEITKQIFYEEDDEEIDNDTGNNTNEENEDGFIENNEETVPIIQQ